MRKSLRASRISFHRIVTDFAASRIALFGMAMFVLILAAALFAPLISPQNPYDLAQLDVMDSRMPPGAHAGDGKMTYWLGTDDQGRDMLSAIFYGLRISSASAWRPRFAPLRSARRWGCSRRSSAGGSTR
jgi:ABC-type dipeptide/oligopeptide/nickel transport system permease subunit